jgi:hypothetical protein
MSEHDARAAARGRDSGLRRVRQLTWRAGAAGVAFSAVVGVALAHHADATATDRQPAVHAQHSSGEPQQPGTKVQQKPKARRHSQQQGQLVIPAQPPQPSSGGGQVTSGGS